MQTKRGISLIVLVISIIVMIILAGAIVLTLNNSGIMENSTDAVEETNLATLKELTQMAWGEAYAKGARTREELKEAVDKALEDNKVDTTKYTIKVKENGVTVKLKNEQGWIQDGLVVKRGNEVLEVGDFIDYDAQVDSYTSTWQVLGTENGELLIMSTKNIASNYIISKQSGFINGVSKLNELCGVYGKGEEAVGARSIRIEDVNRVTGYNPETAEYQKGQADEYGNEVTYWWTGNEAPYYTSTNGSKGDRDGGYKKASFIYFNGTEFVTSTASETATESEPVKITTLTLNMYEYYPTTLTNNSKDEVKGLTTNSKAYIMLFRNTENTSYTGYWLASTYIENVIYSKSVEFGMFDIGGRKNT